MAILDIFPKHRINENKKWILQLQKDLEVVNQIIEKFDDRIIRNTFLSLNDDLKKQLDNFPECTLDLDEIFLNLNEMFINYQNGANSYDLEYCYEAQLLIRVHLRACSEMILQAGDDIKEYIQSEINLSQRDKDYLEYNQFGYQFKAHRDHMNDLISQSIDTYNTTLSKLKGFLNEHPDALAELNQGNSGLNELSDDAMQGLCLQSALVDDKNKIDYLENNYDSIQLSLIKFKKEKSKLKEKIFLPELLEDEQEFLNQINSQIEEPITRVTYRYPSSLDLKSYSIQDLLKLKAYPGDNTNIVEEDATRDEGMVENTYKHYPSSKEFETLSISELLQLEDLEL